jgi:palmitoyl-[glycerolipid] 3-(E)-desaturase
MALGITIVQIVSLSVLSWISADFGSGVLHWSVDNYGNGRTPIMGNIIAAFQGHHTAPWTITQRSFFNNVYKLCIPFGILPVTLLAYLSGPMVTFFVTTFCVLEILSQEFHKWSHQMKSETPWIGNLLQKYHLAIGRVPHTKHHTLPFETNYCIISGICNPILDQYGFFRRLEHFIYQRNGIESNAWKLDPILRQRTLNGIYTPPEL